ncbi:phytanoyl-CoA dioxygenase family protein [Alicyclobacillus fastidiosus]|uniref:Phytanoyl-CoA dioxygenase family protein n=1 Tax=Alicyclobacillus fastidiosus TaxID=392011 RepID=A0ABV5ABZ6_9BACL|nr:phytanoyl-CoA dioxygenase family protein [Alicyclobacillus fastidiosus]WEH11502.1 phytanoyl-CoA dioxygenase family protein [Alicyclobacillus fastidiosus]
MTITEDLENNYPLTGEQITRYQRDGHILLKEVASLDVIDAYRPIIQEEVQRLNRESRPLSERDTYGKAFIQVSNIWESNQDVRNFVMARRFAKIAAELMGVDGVRIYHDQALFKEPGGGHTPWHQDQIYWPIASDHTITLWMPLIDVPAKVGSMTFASGSHKRGYVSKMEISDQSHKTLKDYIDHEGIPTVSYGSMEAGDATFHAGWTMHSAPGNPTDQTREVMTIIYVADGTRVSEPDSNARKNDLKRWLPGLKPGDEVASPLNPVVYRATTSHS